MNESLLSRYFLIIVLISNFCSPCFSQDPDKIFSELKSAQEDIQIINLINGLDLRKEQIEFITRKAEEAKAIREEALNKIRVRSSELTDAFDSIKKEVETGRVVLHKRTERKFKEIEDEIKQIKRDADTKIDDIALSVEGELEPFQINVVDSYKPCIVPIADKGRIGQSENSSGIIRILDIIRKISWIEYNNKKEIIADSLLEKTKAKLPVGIQFEESEIKLKILNTFENVRDMDDVDFQICKEEVAEELKNNILPIKKEMTRKEKIKKLLLSENIIPILRGQLN